MATVIGKRPAQRRNKQLIAALIAGGALVLAATVAFQLRSSFAQERAAAQKAKTPVLLTDVKPVANVAALRDATVHTPRDAAAWSRLGDAMLAASDLPAAVDAYQHAVTIDDTRWPDWSALGEAYVQTAQSNGARLPATARDAFDHALKLHPADMRSQFYLAMERDFTGNHDAAINAWVTMLAQVPIGSKADGAIRGAIIASVARHALTVRDRMSAATAAQKRLPYN